MRINRYVALATGTARRKADVLVQEGRIQVNGQLVASGYDVQANDNVTLDGHHIIPSDKPASVLLNKPVGYVCSRDGQGSKTVYELLPVNLHHLKPVGRLDKDSSGLLLLTSDGVLAHKLTHPSYQKEKIYEIKLNRSLTAADWSTITKVGVTLEDGPSKFRLEPILDTNIAWRVIMQEGRNRQIRRTFSALDYTVKRLHRVTFGEYSLNGLQMGKFKQV